MKKKYILIITFFMIILVSCNKENKKIKYDDIQLNDLNHIEGNKLNNYIEQSIIIEEKIIAWILMIIY